jgi:putative tryptophan/tyrosine transport system substrate-binding protein
MTVSSEQKAVSNKKEKSETMIRRLDVCLLLTVLLFTVSSGVAQERKKIPRIAVLNQSPMTSSEKDHAEAFRQGLRELGYLEGKNIIIEWRNGDGTRTRSNELAAELVRLKVDVIVTAGGGSTRAAKHATTTIPIVMKQDTDPVGNGFVASLARPGGNITGLSRVAPELSGKQLEVLKDAVSKLSRVALFGTSTSIGHAQRMKELELAAGSLGVQLQYIDILTPNDINPAFRSARKGLADAGLMMVSGPVSNPRQKEIVELAVKNRLPVIYRNRGDVEIGGLMSYGVSYLDLDRRAATFVDKILKGRTPAELPVEQPIKFEFVINLKAAKQIGLTVPPNVLARADRIIK